METMTNRELLKDTSIHASLVMLCVVISLLVLALYWSQFRQGMELEQLKIQIDRNNEICLELKRDISAQQMHRDKENESLLRSIKKIVDGDSW